MSRPRAIADRKGISALFMYPPFSWRIAQADSSYVPGHQFLHFCSPLYERGVRGDFSCCDARKSPCPPLPKGGVKLVSRYLAVQRLFPTQSDIHIFQLYPADRKPRGRNTPLVPQIGS